jgi:hypothetical protein
MTQATTATPRAAEMPETELMQSINAISIKQRTKSRPSNWPFEG